MQTHVRIKAQAGSRAEGAARIINSYTCPRCWAWGFQEKCRRCGWTPEMKMAGAAREEELQDCVIAC